jgi:hypothetical protein
VRGRIAAVTYLTRAATDATRFWVVTGRSNAGLTKIVPDAPPTAAAESSTLSVHDDALMPSDDVVIGYDDEVAVAYTQATALADVRWVGLRVAQAFTQARRYRPAPVKRSLLICAIAPFPGFYIVCSTFPLPCASPQRL